MHTPPTLTLLPSRSPPPPPATAPPPAARTISLGVTRQDVIPQHLVEGKLVESVLPRRRHQRRRRRAMSPVIALRRLRSRR